MGHHKVYPATPSDSLTGIIIGLIAIPTVCILSIGVVYVMDALIRRFHPQGATLPDEESGPLIDWDPIGEPYEDYEDERMSLYVVQCDSPDQNLNYETMSTDGVKMQGPRPCLLPVSRVDGEPMYEGSRFVGMRNAVETNFLQGWESARRGPVVTNAPERVGDRTPETESEST